MALIEDLNYNCDQRSIKKRKRITRKGEWGGGSGKKEKGEQETQKTKR